MLVPAMTGALPGLIDRGHSGCDLGQLVFGEQPGRAADGLGVMPCRD
jgi:hypothetical protein